MHILVVIESRGARVGTAYTDGEGQFAFEDLPGNMYHIIVQETGFLPVDLIVQLNPSIQHVMSVHIELTPVEPRPGEKQGGIAGSNPALVDQTALLNKFPSEAKKQFEKAAKFHNQGKRKEAISYYEKALAIAPDMYLARNNLGSLYLENQQFSDAEAQFRKVVEENQTDANGYFNIANVCLLTKRFDEALDFIQQGFKREPTSAFGHFLMGSVMLKKGNQADAEKYLRSALNQDPGLANAHLELVNLYIQQGRNGDATTELSAFLRQSPDSGFAPHARELLKKLQSSPVTPQ